ncbi:Fic/DOC family protein [Verrucosispora sioxanthis]|uniref:protein adenylyltransferase n=1 Tax=Verrucosispora sioxanthis TaxID=2499994 RepID=A0A6M1L8A4_9ACTN|nr:Fic family protein [Verrucosispora sioxanthis]NEE65385.1 cell filamentation protein Fic [Verrucosispora sioxanthis]NGM14495.1 cell filamentation protein Fic [Verrucosispora sioxanthis]
MTETDPYCWPDTDCLKNNLGITDAKQLAEIEARLASIREVQALRMIIPGNYGLEHLQAFHRHIFSDVYPWAGQTRTVDISKPGARFCHWRYIDDQVSAILSRLDEDGFLLGLHRDAFIEALAHYYGELNVCHPFREGNGRTIRAFLRQLAAAAGYLLDWSELNAEANIAACHQHLATTDLSGLIAVLRPVVRRLA